MNDREQWISGAILGVDEEHRRLDQNRPSLERYRQTWLDENRAAFNAQAEWHERNENPLTEFLVRREREKTDVEAEQNTFKNTST